MKWTKVGDKLPTIEENGEKILIWRNLPESQKLQAMSVFNTSMVKYCDKNETYWHQLPEPPNQVNATEALGQESCPGCEGSRNRNLISCDVCGNRLR